MKKNEATDKQSIEVEAKNVESAILKGLEALNVGKESVDVKILDEGTSGLFGLRGAKPARVRLQLKGTEPHGSPGADTEPLPAHDSMPQPPDDKVMKEIEKLLIHHASEIIRNMKITPEKPSISVEPSEGVLKIEITFTEPDIASLLIGRNGRTLSALATILQTILIRQFKDKISIPSIPRISLDINRYRLHRDEKIVEETNKAMEIVGRTGKPYRFNPMTPRERRLIHLVIQDSVEFESVSEGESIERRVVIRKKHGDKKHS
ncbi:MAG: Jag N-terminal domain-containing protein [Elusimicrobia bacterium]|nr:Jag N-terminal domain-containing protein [Elusimicrobiota bacterium]